MDVSTRQAAEADLAGKAAQYRPDELARYAQRVMDWLHPDGDLTDTERARKRGITLSNQAIRRHVTAKWLPDPPSAGHL
ncbi:13E12 repeat family protein [Mycobacterium tuberculosis]|nr:13E12 repeat family protein [Mycobacterium tuberculosis]